MSSRRVKGSAKGCWAREMKDAEKVRGTQENKESRKEIPQEKERRVTGTRKEFCREY